MKKQYLYSIRVERPIDSTIIFHVSADNIAFVASKFYQQYPDAEIIKISYEGVIYV